MRKILVSIILAGMITTVGVPFENATELQVTDLWNGGKTKRIKVDDLRKFPVTMKPGKTKRGGVAVLKIEKLCD
jgi:hypothetical protein